MLSLSVATIVLLATAGAVRMDQPVQPLPFPANTPLGQQQPGGPLSNLGMLGGSGQPGAGLLNSLSTFGQPQSGGLLGGLGSLGGNGQPHGGLLGGLTRVLGGDAQQQQQQQQPAAGLLGALGANGQSNGGLMGSLSNTLGGLGQQQQAGGPLANLLNGNQPMNPNQLFNALGQNQSQNGLSEMLMQLPRRGLDMLGNLIAGMRSMLANNQSMNGMGRDQTMPRIPMQQGQRLINNLPAPLNQIDLSATDNLRKSVTEPLSQGRMPDMNRVSGELSQAASQLGRSLSRSMSMPANSAAPSS